MSNSMCDPLCSGCPLSIATPLLYRDCEKCKSLLKECPDKPGYYYFDTKPTLEHIMRASENIEIILTESLNPKTYFEKHKQDE